MAANPDFDDIVTSTLRSRTGKLADNATTTTSFLDRMRRKGKIKMADGGRTIVQELEVALNPNGGWYAGYDTLSTNAFEPFSAAEYDWKQAYVPAVWNGREKAVNQGESQVIDLIASRLKNTEKSLSDLVAQAAYSDGTSYGGKQLHGLGLFVVASPTSGLVGGIDRQANTFWRNKATTVAVSGGVNIATTNPSSVLAAINSIAISATRGKDSPDLFVADAIGYNAYLSSLQPIQRITSPDMAAAGFVNLQYAGMGGYADFVLDNGYCPTKTIYALNTDYLYIKVHSDRNFAPIGGDRVPVNQDATVRYVGFMGNLCASNLFLQGVITSSN